QVLRSNARCGGLSGQVKWRQEADHASERDQNRGARQEAEQQVDEIAPRSRQGDFHPGEPAEQQKYREAEQNGHAVRGKVQRALSSLWDELMPDGKLKRKPQQRDDDEVHPGWWRSTPRQIRHSYWQERVG